jgi:uncharacterized protein (TIGR00369 family)
MDKKFEDAHKLLNLLTTNFLTQIPFCRLLGLKLEELTFERAVMSFDRKPELIGNFVTNVLHGGVISSVLDNTGGAIAMASVFHKHAGAPFESFKNEVAKVSTIDIRVDYLLPGHGEHFVVTAKPLRVGKRICVSAIELHNEHKHLIAVGTGTYLIG